MGSPTYGLDVVIALAVVLAAAHFHQLADEPARARSNPGGSEGTWHGAFPTYEEARRTAAVMSPQKGVQLNCRLCHPRSCHFTVLSERPFNFLDLQGARGLGFRMSSSAVCEFSQGAHSRRSRTTICRL